MSRTKTRQPVPLPIPPPAPSVLPADARGSTPAHGGDVTAADHQAREAETRSRERDPADEQVA